MIAEYNMAVLTAKGMEATGKQLAYGSVIEFTRFGVGDGSYSEDEKDPAYLEGVTDLKSERNTYPIQSKEVGDDGRTVALKFTISNCDEEGGSLVDEDYYANEIGLFARLDGGEEFLFSIAACSGDVGDAILAYNGRNKVQIVQTYSAKVGNAANVTVNMQGAYALALDLESLTEMFAGLFGFSYVEERSEILNLIGCSIDGETVRIPEEVAQYGADGEVITLMQSATVIPSGGGGAYVLPIATAERLGGVKIGSGVSATGDGTISVDAESILNDYDVMATDEEVEEAIGG